MADREDVESIPNAKVGQIIDLLEQLRILGGTCDRGGLAYALGVTEPSVYASTRAAHLLGLIDVDEQQVILTEIGTVFLDSNEADRRRAFGQQLLRNEPFATIARAVEQGPLTGEQLMNYVRARIPSAREWKDTTIREMLRTIGGWCIYGGLLVYNRESKEYLRPA